MKVLELGCGNGRIVTLPVAEQGFDVLGIDSHLPSIEAARAHNRLDHMRFECGDFSDAPASGDFHAVILSDVLEHVDDPERMLGPPRPRCGRRSPAGLDPNGYGPYEVEQFLIRKGILGLSLALVRRGVQLGVRAKQALQGAPPPDPEPPAYNFDSPHVQHFTLRRVQGLLQSRGFRIECRSNGSWFGGDLTYFLFYFVPRLVPVSLASPMSCPRSSSARGTSSAAVPTSPMREGKPPSPCQYRSAHRPASSHPGDDEHLEVACRTGAAEAAACRRAQADRRHEPSSSESWRLVAPAG